MILFPVFRNLRLDDAAIVIEAGGELIVRQVVVEKNIALMKKWAAEGK